MENLGNFDCQYQTLYDTQNEMFGNHKLSINQTIIDFETGEINIPQLQSAWYSDC